MKIEEIFSNDLKTMLKDKLAEMVKDSGQKVTPDDAVHLVSRMFYFLQNKFKTTTWQLVCDAFDKGMLGDYGMSKQITVNNLTFWIHKRKKEEEDKNRGSRSENTDVSYFEWKDIYNTPVSEFLVFARVKADIDINKIDPLHDPETTKSVSPKIKSLTSEYVAAKAKNKLESFRVKIQREYPNE